MLGLFLQAVQQYGLPSRVRSDNGGEYTYVDAMVMLIGPQRGSNRGSLSICWWQKESKSMLIASM